MYDGKKLFGQQGDIRLIPTRNRTLISSSQKRDSHYTMVLRKYHLLNRYTPVSLEIGGVDSQVQQNGDYLDISWVRD